MVATATTTENTASASHADPKVHAVQWAVQVHAEKKVNAENAAATAMTEDTATFANCAKELAVTNVTTDATQKENNMPCNCDNRWSDNGRREIVRGDQLARRGLCELENAKCDIEEGLFEIERGLFTATRRPRCRRSIGCCECFNDRPGMDGYLPPTFV